MITICIISTTSFIISSIVMFVIIIKLVAVSISIITPLSLPKPENGLPARPKILTLNLNPKSLPTPLSLAAPPFGSARRGHLRLAPRP